MQSWESLIPDSIEPLRAWRYWRVSRVTSRLRSLTGTGPEWLPGQALQAECRFRTYDPDDRRFQLVTGFTRTPHRSPGEGCTCGIYASRDLKHLRGQMLFGLGSMVVGVVSLWGKIVPGQHGFRAEYAYPQELRVIERTPGGADPIVEALSVYGVPVGVVRSDQASVRPAYVMANALTRVATGVRGLSSTLRSSPAR